MEKKTKTVLFVCTGNTCRSPMAETLAKEYLRKKNDEDSSLRIISAGLAVFADAPASPQAQEVMLELNLDLSAHRARQLTAELLQEADLILAMTAAQKSYIEEMLSAIYKDNKDGKDNKEESGNIEGNSLKTDHKVYLLKEYALGGNLAKGEDEDINNQDILDPFGQSAEVYRACAQELSLYIPQALERFKGERSGCFEDCAGI